MRKIKTDKELMMNFFIHQFGYKPLQKEFNVWFKEQTEKQR